VSLSTFIDYFLCAGQGDAQNLGYSPIPLNLVKGGLLQVTHIPWAGATPNPTTLAGCDNPTFTDGVLTVLKDAPYPNKCQYYTEPLSCGSGGSSGSDNGSDGSKSGANSGNPGSGGSGSGDPADGAGGGGGSGATATNVSGQVVNLAADDADQPALGALTAIAILVAIGVPPALAIWLRRRRRQSPG
jgi:hypothetical protein